MGFFILNVNRAVGISKDWGGMSYKKRNGKGVKDEVSSATQMEPGRETM